MNKERLREHALSPAFRHSGVGVPLFVPCLLL